MNDASGHGIPPPEHEACLVEVAAREGFADARGAHFRVAVKEERRSKDLKMMLAPEGFERLHVARAVAAESEVFAHRDPARVESVDEDVLNEGFCAERSRPAAEGQHVDAFDPRGENGVDFVEQG